VVRAAYGVSSFSESTGHEQSPISKSAVLPFLTTSLTFPQRRSQAAHLTKVFSAFPVSGCTVATVTSAPAACVFSGAGIHAFDPDFRPAVSPTVQRERSASTGKLHHVASQLRRSKNTTSGLDLPDQPAGPESGRNHFPESLLRRKPNPGQRWWGQSRLSASNGYSNYNALQIVAQQRMRYGLQFSGELHLVEMSHQLVGILRGIRRCSQHAKPGRQQLLFLPEYLQPQG